MEIVGKIERMGFMKKAANNTWIKWNSGMHQ
jgi:hypothetical protein